MQVLNLCDCSGLYSAQLRSACNNSGCHLQAPALFEHIGAEAIIQYMVPGLLTFVNERYCRERLRLGQVYRGLAESGLMVYINCCDEGIVPVPPECFQFLHVGPKPGRQFVAVINEGVHLDGRNHGFMNSFVFKGKLGFLRGKAAAGKRENNGDNH